MVCAVAAAQPVSSAQPPGLQKIDSELLPNAYRVSEKVASGGQPAGEAGFAKLRELGVKTIISVDGARPDVEAAKRHGLRYIHLPHSYDGIPDQRAKELAKAVRDMPGLVYIHCHHGKHRSPAAAAVACVTVGLLAPEAALGVLTTAGTSENYRGLYQSAQAARPLDGDVLDAVAAEFPETVRVPPIADAMVEIEHTHDHLKALAAGGWRRLAKQPDLDPPHEALLLKEYYHELMRTADVQQQPAEFQAMLQAAEKDAAELEAALRTWHKAGASGTPPEAIGKSYTAISQSCTACHKQFRDVPLAEKGRGAQGVRSQLRRSRW